MKKRIADLLVNNPKLTLLGIFLFIGATSAGLFNLKSNFSEREWFGPNDPYLKAYENYERDFGNDDSVVIVVHSPSGIFDQETVKVLKDLTEQLWRTPSVIRVDSLSNHLLTGNKDGDVVIEDIFKSEDAEFLKKREQEISKNDFLRSYLISKDMKTAAIYGQLKPIKDNFNEYNHSVHAVKDFLDKYPNKGDHQFHVAGSAALTTAYYDISGHDLRVLTPLLVLLVGAIVYWYFRSIASTLLLLGILGLSIVMAFGVAGWVGINYNSMTSCLPQILISITLAEGIHFLSAFYRMRNSGESKKEAAHHAISENLTPTFMTSFTTALGFVTFYTSNLKPVCDLGILASIAIMLAWLLTVLLLPIVLLYIPSSTHSNFKETQQKKHKWIHSYLRWVAKYKVPVLASWTILFGVSIYLSTLNTVNSDLVNYFSESTEIKKANHFINDHFGGSRGFEIVFDSGAKDGVKEIPFLEKVIAFQDWVRTQDHVTKVTSITDIIEELNKAIDDGPGANQRLPESNEAVAQQLFLYSMSLPVGMNLNYWATLSYQKMRMRVLWNIEDSELAQTEMDRIAAQAKTYGLTATITGKAALRPGISHNIIETLNSANFQSLILISLCMIFLFRSLPIGLIAMVPNVIPPAFASGIMVLLGIQYDVGTILVMSVVLGIAVDDTIHFLTTYTELKKEGQPTLEAIIGVFDRTGSSITLTTVVLVSSFSLAFFSQFIPYLNFGLMTATSLSLALFADLMLLPAIFLLSDDIRAKFKKPTAPKSKSSERKSA